MGTVKLYCYIDLVICGMGLLLSKCVFRTNGCWEGCTEIDPVYHLPAGLGRMDLKQKYENLFAIMYKDQASNVVGDIIVHYIKYYFDYYFGHVSSKLMHHDNALVLSPCTFCRRACFAAMTDESKHFQ
jgi:hypothetical protein